MKLKAKSTELQCRNKQTNESSLRHQLSLYVVCLEPMSISSVKLGLELHPVQSQCVQEALKHIHAKQNTNGDTNPGTKSEIDDETTQKPIVASLSKRHQQCVLVENG